MHQLMMDVASALLVLVLLFVTGAGPVLVMKLLKRWNLSNEKNEKEIEAKANELFHAAAARALTFAMAKLGKFLPTGADGLIDKDVLSVATDYVLSKSPENVAKVGATIKDVKDVIVGKVPAVTAMVVAAANAKG